MKITGEYKNFIKNIFWIAKKSKGITKSLITIILLDAFTSLAGVATAVFSKHLIDSAVGGNFYRAVLYAATFGILIVCSLGARAATSVISVRTGEALANSIREQMFSRIAKTEWFSVTRYHSGDILTRLTSDVGAIATGVTDTLPGIVYLCIQLTAAFGTLLYYEPTLAVLAFVLGPFTVLFSRIWGRKMKRLQIKVQESESAYRSFIQEAVENMTVVKTFRLEEKNTGTISRLHNERLGWVKKRNATGVIASTVLGTGYWAGYFLAFC